MMQFLQIWRGAISQLYTYLFMYLGYGYRYILTMGKVVDRVLSFLPRLYRQYWMFSLPVMLILIMVFLAILEYPRESTLVTSLFQTKSLELLQEMRQVCVRAERNQEMIKGIEGKLSSDGVVLGSNSTTIDKYSGFIKKNSEDLTDMQLEQIYHKIESLIAWHKQQQQMYRDKMRQFRWLSPRNLLWGMLMMTALYLRSRFFIIIDAVILVIEILTYCGSVNLVWPTISLAVREWWGPKLSQVSALFVKEEEDERDPPAAVWVLSSGAKIDASGLQPNAPQADQSDPVTRKIALGECQLHRVIKMYQQLEDVWNPEVKRKKLAREEKKRREMRGEQQTFWTTLASASMPVRDRAGGQIESLIALVPKYYHTIYFHWRVYRDYSTICTSSASIFNADRLLRHLERDEIFIKRIISGIETLSKIEAPHDKLESLFGLYGVQQIYQELLQLRLDKVMKCEDGQHFELKQGQFAVLQEILLRLDIDIDPNEYFRFVPVDKMYAIMALINLKCSLDILHLTDSHDVKEKIGSFLGQACACQQTIFNCQLYHETKEAASVFLPKDSKLHNKLHSDVEWSGPLMADVRSEVIADTDVLFGQSTAVMSSLFGRARQPSTCFDFCCSDLKTERLIQGGHMSKYVEGLSKLYESWSQLQPAIASLKDFRDQCVLELLACKDNLLLVQLKNEKKHASKLLEHLLDAVAHRLSPVLKPVGPPTLSMQYWHHIHAEMGERLEAILPIVSQLSELQQLIDSDDLSVVAQPIFFPDLIKSLEIILKMMRKLRGAVRVYSICLADPQIVSRQDTKYGFVPDYFMSPIRALANKICAAINRGSIADLLQVIAEEKICGGTYLPGRLEEKGTLCFAVASQNVSSEQVWKLLDNLDNVRGSSEQEVWERSQFLLGQVCEVLEIEKQGMSGIRAGEQRNVLFIIQVSRAIRKGNVNDLLEIWKGCANMTLTPMNSLVGVMGEILKQNEYIVNTVEENTQLFMFLPDMVLWDDLQSMLDHCNRELQTSFMELLEQRKDMEETMEETMRDKSGQELLGYITAELEKQLPLQTCIQNIFSIVKFVNEVLYVKLLNMYRNKTHNERSCDVSGGPMAIHCKAKQNEGLLFCLKSIWKQYDRAVVMEKRIMEPEKWNMSLISALSEMQNQCAQDLQDDSPKYMAEMQQLRGISKGISKQIGLMLKEVQT